MERDRLLLRAAVAFQQGAFTDAQALGEELLRATPGFPPGYLLLGMIAARTGQVSRAIALLRDAVAYEPCLVEARNELATLLRAEGDHSEAIRQCRSALVAQPDNAASHINLGLCFLADQRPADAEPAFARAIALAPGGSAVHYNHGLALQRLGRETEAMEAYRQAVGLGAANGEPSGEAMARLGHLLRISGELERGAAYIGRAASVSPKSALGCLQLARVLAELGEAGAAEIKLCKALELDPMLADAHWQLGVLQQQLGRFEEAQACLERVIELWPEACGAYLDLVGSRKIGKADGNILARMETLLTEAGLTERDRSKLHYALGKAEDDLGEYASAMRHFDAANRICSDILRRTGRTIDRVGHRADIDQIIATFTKEFFARHAGEGHGSELPVFIVGMIRSGTTLLEQVLASHPQIAAGGELRFWGEKGKQLGDAAAGTLGNEADRVASQYLQILHAIAPLAARTTDKMPTNFMMIGLIHLLLPKARIINCRRDPVDTCLSIYVTPYANLPDYAHDRDNIAFYYEEYRRLMAHWREVLPVERFIDTDYEMLVSEPEVEARRLIEFCGLNWDPACLRHTENAGAIRTPSIWQARQPVYRSSMQRWQRYHQSLGAFARLRPGNSVTTQIEAAAPRSGSRRD